MTLPDLPWLPSLPASPTLAGLAPRAVDLAEMAGLRIRWRAHARFGIPVSLLSLALVWIGLA